MSEAGDTSPQPGNTSKPKAGDRRRARALAMQGLYQRHFSKSPISDIEAEFMVDNDMSKVDLMYFRDLLRGAYKLKCRIDVPYKVAMNEGIEMAKRFGGT